MLKHSTALIGMCHQIGEGVRQDKKEAVRWLTIAAQQGDECAHTVSPRLMPHAWPGLGAKKEGGAEVVSVCG